jgi:CRISP-associated protein Cas1
LLYQAKLALDDELRLKVVREMYRRRFNEEAPTRRSVEQLRGIEGARVRKLYKNLALQHGVPWEGRSYDIEDWGAATPINRALSAATSCLYGITEAAVLAAGYAPAIGFVHSGKPLSFVYDVADLYKFDTVVPLAFAAAKRNLPHLERDVRLRCRDLFRQTQLLSKIIPDIEEMLAAAGEPLPLPAPEALPPAIPEPTAFGEAGHRH